MLLIADMVIKDMLGVIYAVQACCKLCIFRVIFDIILCVSLSVSQ